jgi:DNA-binding NarL/FixJ family response regulator
MIRIAIADDQMLLRQMLSMILSRIGEFTVVGEAENGDDILTLCRERKPDIVLMDIKMPVSDGISALIHIKNEFPEIKVIILTTFGDEKNVLRAYECGADGYLLKDVRPDMLARSIQCVQDGLFVMHESIHAMLRAAVRSALAGRPAQLDMADSCTTNMGWTRSTSDLKLITAGKNNREIGES